MKNYVLAVSCGDHVFIHYKKGASEKDVLVEHFELNPNEVERHATYWDLIETIKKLNDHMTLLIAISQNKLDHDNQENVKQNPMIDQ